MENDRQTRTLIRQIEAMRQKPGISRSDMFNSIRDYFQDDDECETFITTAITRIHAEEQIREYREFQKNGIQLDLFWNVNPDELVCDECRARAGKPGPWDESPPPLHKGCRCWLTMRIKR